MSLIPPQVVNLLNLKGQIVTLTTLRDCKVRKGEAIVQKLSKFQCVIGVNYDNLVRVQEKRESGELPAANAGLPWGEWLIFPHVITHNGEYYLRCTTLRGGNPTKVTFHRDGVEIAREEAESAFLAAEFRDHRDNDVFNVKVSNIMSVNGERVE